MKISIPIRTLTLLACFTAVGQAAAADFGSYSNQELFQLQDQTRYMSSEDRDAYRSEKQVRMQNMSQEDRLSMRSDGSQGGYRSMSGSGNGQGSMTRSRVRDGSGGGQGKRHGQGGGRRQ